MKRDYASELGALGYPKFSYLKKQTEPDPAELLFDLIDESNLDSRVVEGLPWLALTHVDINWNRLVQNANLHGRQNRLGFIAALAVELAHRKNDSGRESVLREQLERLEQFRSSKEDTLCHDSMTNAEREWLRQHRSSMAAHWNILSDMKAEDFDASLY